ncbi:hypothetical protein ACRRTK_013571 [Alexandromys fortis]
MRPEQALLWYRRMAMLYALGSWWVLGSVIILTRTPKEQGYGEEQKDGWRDETPFITFEDSDSESIDKPYVRTYVKYKDGFIPVTQRIMDRLKSWIGGPGPQS